jgi:hypothetical protein
MKFEDLVGKTIASTTQMKPEQYDDEGYLRLQFTDGAECFIVAGYGGYSGESEDEYQTKIWIVENLDLIPIEEMNDGS